MAFLDFIFPKFCVGCQKLGTYLCPDCILKIKQKELVCPICERVAMGGATHPLCHKKYGLDGLWSLGTYEGPLRSAIQKLKYKFVTELAGELIELTINYWASNKPFFFENIIKNGAENWIIVPVPLHPKRQNWRGFNQSSLFGQLLSKKIGIKYLEALQRINYTKPQVGMRGYQRRVNIRNAFALTMPYTLNANILLVDDVWTTGSTLKECCYVLKRGGAKEVWAITLAR